MNNAEGQAPNGQSPDVASGKPLGIPEQTPILDALETWLESHNGVAVTSEEEMKQSLPDEDSSSGVGNLT